MGKNISLRLITDKDLGFLSEVYASTRQEEVMQTGWSQQQIDEFLQMQFEAQHKHYQQHYPAAQFEIIEYNNQAVGRLYVDRWENEIRIVDIALLNAFRQQGIGSYLLQQLIAESEQKHLPIRIHVEKNNPALSLYGKLGFVAEEDKGVYWLMKRPPEKKGAMEKSTI